MKFSQLIKHQVKNIFLEKSHRKGGRETSSTPFFVEKALHEIKARGQHLSLNIFIIFIIIIIIIAIIIIMIIIIIIIVNHLF